jgi:glycosyltransferase involved in cell wall biosynthesis
MISGYNLIYFGPEKWDGLWRNRHQLMSRFAKKNKVLYVEPRYKLKRTRAKWRKGELKLKNFFTDLYRNRITPINTNLLIYHSPLFAPISNRFPLSKLTEYFWKTILKRTVFKMGFHNSIVWVSRPSMINLLGELNEKMVIYHVVDEYQAYSGKVGQRENQKNNLERLMLGKADLVIVVSKKLYETKKPFNQNTHLIPNAVDYFAYAEALDSDKQIFIDVGSLAGPKIGYSGLIAAKLNLKLLGDMATTHPEWSIILLGAVDDRHSSEELNLLKKIKNIHFIDKKNISEVPYYIKELDVCIAPYKINEHSQNISPLKLYDYLATGKPIVCTDFPAARMFEDVIYIANSEHQFTSLVEKALRENDNDLSTKRRYIASRNTWDDRVNQISMLMCSTLQDIKGTGPH